MRVTSLSQWLTKKKAWGVLPFAIILFVFILLALCAPLIAPLDPLWWLYCQFVSQEVWAL
jgi:NhaP-type Na+/H+ or K+/H+ antiporter